MNLGHVINQICLQSKNGNNYVTLKCKLIYVTKPTI